MTMQIDASLLAKTRAEEHEADVWGSSSSLPISINLR